MDQANYERGLQLFELGRYRDAIPFLKTSLNQDPDSFHVKYLLAQCFFLTDDIATAKKMILELRADAPNYDGVYFILSQINLHEQKPKEALTDIDTAIGLNPSESIYYGQKAYVLLYQKQFEKALDFANEGLRIDSKDSFCLNARATALTKLKRHDELESTIQNLLSDNPEDSSSHASVGWSYLEKNNISKAREHFKEALKLNPNSTYARDGMANAVKAKNWIYNLYLRYQFWISNKSERNQWIFIIGIYVVYRIAVRSLSSAGMTALAIPLIILYLLFALGSWIMDPLSNMILMFDRYGKYLLGDDDRLSGQIFFGLVMAALSCFGLNYLLDDMYLIILGLAFLAAILPLTRFPLSFNKRSKNINLVYGVIIVLIALVGGVLRIDPAAIGIAVGLMFIAYTWLYNFLIKG